MSYLTLNESVAPSTPAAAKVSAWADTTANPQLLFKDDAGLVVTLIDSRNTVTQIGNKDFADGTFTISNVSPTSKAVKFALSGMTAAVVLTLSSSQSTAQTLTIPNITGADTIVVTTLAQTIGGVKTMTGANVITHANAGNLTLNPAATFTVQLTPGAEVANRILNIPLLGATDTLMTLALAQTVTGALTCTGLNAVLMSSSGLTIRNPANTFSYTITAAAIVAARTLNLPLTIATDTLMCLGLAQTVTGILTLTTPVIGAATGTSLAVTGLVTSSGAAAGGIGYAVGAGGTVTQATSKVTAFTLSKLCGTITFAADSLAADASSAGAVWTNTQIAANDIILFIHTSGGTLGAYNIACTAAAGSATVVIRNVTPGALAEAPAFKFVVIKGVVT